MICFVLGFFSGVNVGFVLFAALVVASGGGHDGRHYGR